MTDRIKFSEIKQKVAAKPGIYEIYTFQGVPLKVGIAKNLKRRLLAHGESKQAYLKKNTEGRVNNPSDLTSKRSILAKHLYFDSSITVEYDLKTEQGRKSFLENNCYIKIEITKTRELAREIEKVRESIGKFRYVGRVIRR